MAQYAKNTSVSVEMSRIEIERVLIRYGAENFAYAVSNDKAMIAFKMHNRQVKFMLPLPSIKNYELTPTGRQRSDNSKFDAWEQDCRQRWRALKLVIQAKLEAVECGISEFEDEFMSYIVLPGGDTVGNAVRPQIEQAYNSGNVPELTLLKE